MEELPQFAEQYTKSEKIKRISIIVIILIVIFAGWRFWLAPLLYGILYLPDQYTLFGQRADEFLSNWTIVIFPLILFLLCGIYPGIIAYKILCDMQYPPIGKKVYTKTKIIRGYRAKLIAFLLMTETIVLLGLIVWGAYMFNIINKC